MATAQLTPLLSAAAIQGRAVRPETARQTAVMISWYFIPRRTISIRLVSQQAELGAIFRVLGMPGALPCLHFLLRQPNTDLFSVPYLAGKAGASEEEIAAFLEAALPLGLCVGQKVRRNGQEEKLYRAFGPLPLLGLFAAAKLLLRRDGANLRRYGHQIGSVTPPIYEKGENA